MCQKPNLRGFFLITTESRNTNRDPAALGPVNTSNKQPSHRSWVHFIGLYGRRWNVWPVRKNRFWDWNPPSAVQDDKSAKKPSSGSAWAASRAHLRLHFPQMEEPRGLPVAYKPPQYLVSRPGPRISFYLLSAARCHVPPAAPGTLPFLAALPGDTRASRNSRIPLGLPRHPGKRGVPSPASPPSCVQGAQNKPRLCAWCWKQSLLFGVTDGSRLNTRRRTDR